FSGALVNASNAEIRPGGGVAGGIWDVCGHEELLWARQLLVGLDADPSMRRAILRPGEAVWTTAGRGSERGFSGIIHAHGPRWRSAQERDSGGRITPDHGEDVQLRQTWRSVLRVADENGARRLVAPMISTGIYGFPAPEGFEIAFDTLIGTKSAVENVVVRTNSRRVFDQLVVSRQKVLGRHNPAG
ncbi:MAG: macro domain-containing protein, partial [Actinomycetota bacterium]